MPDATTCCHAPAGSDPRYCHNCDVMVGLDGFHVVEVAEQGRWLVVTVETPPGLGVCPVCGVLAASHGRRLHRLVDIPAFGRPVHLVWRKRTWRCVEALCPGRAFSERADRLARPRALLTVRACWWAIGQLRREHASVQGLARRLGCSWRTVWSSIQPLLEKMAADEFRFDGVTTLGVDEHIVRREALSRSPSRAAGW